MAAVVTAATVEGSARGGCFAVGKALHEAKRVADLEPAYFGVSGLVEDDGGDYDVWVGIRRRMLIGECDCPDADPQASSEEHLEAVAAGRAETPGLCAHAVAVALAAIEHGLPWAQAPASQRDRLAPDGGPRTTAPPPLDITSVFPELAPLARPAVRLHPRAGEPSVRDSSLGGPLLWPVDEAWPVCAEPHCNGEQIPVPPQITSWDEARVWARHALGDRAGLMRHDDGPIFAVVSSPQPPRQPSPMIGVLQLYAADVPDLPFPEGTDCFQLLWCPNAHDEPWYGPRPVAVWRRTATVTETLATPPEPSFDAEAFADSYEPLPCLLHPEPVTEYPDAADLSGELRKRIEEWEEQTGGLYWAALSTAPGTKAGGHPRWIQDPQWPGCRCGQPMQHLLTIASDEFGPRRRWLPVEERDGAAFSQPRPTVYPDALAPHGIMLGDAGSLYLFTCTSCEQRPLGGRMQCT